MGSKTIPMGLRRVMRMSPLLVLLPLFVSVLLPFPRWVGGREPSRRVPKLFLRLGGREPSRPPTGGPTEELRLLGGRDPSRRG